jgi:hypothetical protein
MVNNMSFNRSLGCKWTIRVQHLDGSLVDEISGMNSFLIAYVQILKASFVRGSESIKCIDGTTRSLGWKTVGLGNDGERRYSGFDLVAEDNADDVGIVVGTGLTITSPTDFKLNTKVLHGITNGTLNYEPQVIEAIEITETSVTQNIVRSFINNGSNSIAISEIGMYAKLFDDSGNKHSVCIVRDSIPTIICASGYVVVVIYSIFTGV